MASAAGQWPPPPGKPTFVSPAVTGIPVPDPEAAKAARPPIPPFQPHEMYYTKADDSCCGCGVQLTLFTFGWVLSILGFGPLLWYVGASLPCCAKSMMYGRNRCGWISNLAMSTVVTMLWVVALSSTVYVNTVALEDFTAQTMSEFEFMN